MRVAGRANDVGRTKQERAGIDRSAGDIDTEQMDGDNKYKPIASPARSNRRAFLCVTPGGENEKQEGACHLIDEGRIDVVLAEIAGAPAVLAERSGPARGLAREDEGQHGGAGDGARAPARSHRQ